MWALYSIHIFACIQQCMRFYFLSVCSIFYFMKRCCQFSPFLFELMAEMCLSNKFRRFGFLCLLHSHAVLARLSFFSRYSVCATPFIWMNKIWYTYIYVCMNFFSIYTHYTCKKSYGNRPHTHIDYYWVENQISMQKSFALTNDIFVEMILWHVKRKQWLV